MGRRQRKVRISSKYARKVRIWALKIAANGLGLWARPLGCGLWAGAGARAAGWVKLNSALNGRINKT